MNTPRAKRSDDDPVPQLPRGGGLRLARGSIFRIAMFGTLLAGVLLLREPCSDGIGRFIDSFDDPDAMPGDAPGMDASTQPVPGFIHIKGDMSDEEIRQLLDQAGVLDVPDGGVADGGVADASPAQKDGSGE